MTHTRFARCFALGLSLACCAISPSYAQIAASRPAPVTWRFGGADGWRGWSPSPLLHKVSIGGDCVAFEAPGPDPLIIGPAFSWPGATNQQHVEIDLEVDRPGEGELYFARDARGPDQGFQAQWFVPVSVTKPGRQVVRVYPFWQTLGRVERLRFDPPMGTRCRLFSIRVVDDASPHRGTGLDVWQTMHAARAQKADGSLRATALEPMAMMLCPLGAIDASKQAMLRLDVDCPGEREICLYWADTGHCGLWGEPIELPRDGGVIAIDLRAFPEWAGTITHLAIGFGSRGGETLTLRHMSIEACDVSKPLLRLRWLGYASGVGRPGITSELRLLLELAAGPDLPATQALFSADDNAACQSNELTLPQMKRGDRVELRPVITPRSAGTTQVTLRMNGQTFSRTLQIAPPVETQPIGEYPVPPPRPVANEYEIGVYYYPGWFQENLAAWKRQAELPERDPLLGWYKEGDPVVADWHIKWALENGFSFFLYDWYWQKGKEELGPALNDGFLKARYNTQMKFAVMWANHKPFSDHTLEQLLTVTDYWIDHYLKRPNYLRVDGNPYVSFYSPMELLRCIGSPEKVREALDVMRERAKSAGLPGLHIGAVDIASQVAPETLATMGFDSFTAYTYSRTGATTAHSLHRPYVLGFQNKWTRSDAAGTPRYIPALAVGWDGPVWYGGRSERRRGRRTENLKEAFTRLKAFMDHTRQKMAILEAWNEWGEGAYIEPNVEFGFGDLEAVRSTFAAPASESTPWPANICPDDLGLRGRWDQRLKPATQTAP